MKRIPVATELAHHDRIWPAVMVSVAVHAAAIGLAAKASSLPTIELEQTPIKARLVRLGEKKPESYLPQKETPPPPPEPAPAAPAPPITQTTPPAPPSPSAMPTPAPAPAPAKAAGRASPVRNPANGGGVAAALARMEQQVQRERWGDPNGDPEGDSSEGTEGERFVALVIRAFQANYQVPTTIPERERLYLKAYVSVWVEPDGTITRWKITRSSGNPVFDAALDRAIRATSRLPPPPENDREAFRTRGLPLEFNLQNQ